jgi:hypothetical protein
MKKEHLEWLQANKACKESIKWIKQNNIQSLEDAWNICKQGDWLLWMATKLKVDKRKLVLCAALCAHTVVQYMKDPRSRNAVRIAFLWGRGKATDKQLEAAKTDTWAVVAAAATTIAWANAAATDKKSNQLRITTIIKKVLTEDVIKKLKEIK